MVARPQDLLGNAGLQQLVIFIIFAKMVVLFIPQILVRRKEILTDLIQSNVVQIVGIRAHLKDRFVLVLRQMPNVVCLRQIHDFTSFPLKLYGNSGLSSHG